MLYRIQGVSNAPKIFQRVSSAIRKVPGMLKSISAGCRGVPLDFMGGIGCFRWYHIIPGNSEVSEALQENSEGF